MTNEQQVESGVPSSRRADASVRLVVQRVWRAVVTHRGLVAGILALGLVEAVFSKAPVLLFEPLIRALQSVEPDSPSLLFEADVEANWTDAFIVHAGEIASWVGLASDTPGNAGTAWNVLVTVIVLGGLCIPPGAVAIYGVLVLSRYFAARIVVELRNEIAGHILRLPLRFFGVRRMGELLSNITNDTQVLSRAFTLAVDHVVTDPLLILMNLGILLIVLPEASWLLLLMIPIMALPMYSLGRKVRRRSSRSLEAMGDATESMNQMLTGIRTVKAFQLESQRLQEFVDSNDRYLRRTRRMFIAKARGQSITFFGYQVLALAVLLLMGWMVIGGEGVDFAQLPAVGYALGTTYTHVKRLTRAYNVLHESTGAMDGIEGLLREQPDEGFAQGGTVVERLRGEVAFENVHFAYEPGEPVLRGISFRVEPGRMVALVGPSGGGKSTTLDLIARFHDPQGGVVRIDGHDLRTLDLAAYRRHVAVVSQQPFLFNTTIRQNILYGRPGATGAEVERAARAAHVHDFVVGLPGGYETVVGERGSKLSGGQMQRLTIARAILRDPAILLLDEATSALDSESEELIQRGLHELMKGRTSFVIAHRLSTVQDADVILVLEDGRIAETGTHAELVAHGGTYRRLWDLQRGTEAHA